MEKLFRQVLSLAKERTHAIIFKDVFRKLYRMEILTPSQYGELDRFVASHPQSSFTQCAAWRQVKANWGFEAVACRNEAGELVGSISVLVQKIPFLGTSFLYAPRGPVCDLHDREVLRCLISGVDRLAKKHCAHTFKMDPDVPASDEAFLALAQELGFTRFWGPDGFETIQARFNYRLMLEGRNEDELMSNLTQQTRRNLRIAIRDGIEIRVVGPEMLGEFMRIMELTGERDGFNTRPREYFERFLSALGEHARLYLGFYEGQAISGAITTNFGGKSCYVYGASDNECRNHMPNYLMQWEMIRWAVETGCSVYDFQGVSGNLSPENNHMYGLYRFKKGFNGQIDELAGEFDFVYRPLRAKLVDRALALHAKLRHLRARS